MTDEEKKAIEYVKAQKGKYYKIVIDLIEKQQHIIEGKECVISTQAHNEEVLLEQLEKQQNIINEMAEQLTTPIHDKEWIIKYYTKKVKEEN